MHYIRGFDEELYEGWKVTNDVWYPVSGGGNPVTNTNVKSLSKIDVSVNRELFITKRADGGQSMYVAMFDFNDKLITNKSYSFTNGTKLTINDIPSTIRYVILTFFKSNYEISVKRKGEEYLLEGTISHEQEINGDERIEVDILPTENNKLFLKDGTDLNMWIITFENKEYRIISSNLQPKGDTYFVSCTGILLFLDDMNNSRIYERIDRSFTNQSFYDFVFAKTPYQPIVVDKTGSLQFEGLGEGETRLEIMKTGLERFGHEIQIEDKVVYFKKQIGNDTNFEYRYQVNAANLKKEVNATDMWTHIKGFGNYSDDDETEDVTLKAKLKREYTSPIEKILGHRREAPPIIDGRITIQNTMDEKLMKTVEESTMISFEADIYDMTENGYDYQHANLGDRTFLVDDRINLNTEIRVVQISRKIDANGHLLDISITFGTQTSGQSYEAKFNTAVKDITDILEGHKYLPFNSLSEVAKSMIKKLKNVSSEIVFDENGMHAISKRNPNHIVTYNSEGWFISTDGGTTMKTGATAEGIVADAITTGTLLTQNVRVKGTNGLIYMSGSELVTLGRDNDSATYIRPNGMRVKRPDGVWATIDGIPNYGLSVQRNVFMSPEVNWNGQDYITSHDFFVNYENFYIYHDAKNLVAAFGVGLTEESPSNTAYVDVQIAEFGSDGGNIVAEKRVLATKDSMTFDGITIDLGPPTYQPKQFYLRFKNGTGNSSNRVRVRTNRVYLKG